MKYALLVDFGSTFTKVTAVDLSDGKIIGSSRAFTTVGTDIAEGLDLALKELHAQTGKLEFFLKLACSSAAGGLKMVVSGLVPDLTAEAAKRAALNAGARVEKVFSYELDDNDIKQIYGLKPDILLLTGGTDGGDKKVLLHNAQMVSRMEVSFPVVIAGNKFAAIQAVGIISDAGRDVVACDNVMPEMNVLNIGPAQEAIRNIFLGRIIKAKGLSEVQTLLDGIVMPTPQAVLKAAGRLGHGTTNEPGIGELMVVDVGGATTDVHSIAAGEPSGSGAVLKGLQEPVEKRTVEGDLGVRYNIDGIINAVGYKYLVEKSTLAEENLNGLLSEVRINPGLLPMNNTDLKYLDSALASAAVKISVGRHAGKMECCYTPTGPVYIQTGKDLTDIKAVIGTGGPVIDGMNARNIMEEALFDDESPMVLKPKKPQIYLDEKYILAAMGLLDDKYPDVALRIMKKELTVL